LGTFGLVFLAIAALFAADTFLAKTERAERLVEAARLFERGRVLMQRGQDGEAIEPITNAISIERGNRNYHRVLAQAQLDAGKTADAEATLTDLLQSESSDGLASLLMARVLVKTGRFAQAVSYYHRAIYGNWSEDATENRLRARFELIDLLAQRNSKEELLAELLAVQDRAPQDLKTLTRIARLFLQAGSPARAADVFRAILQITPANADAYAGLGEAEFARGNYRAAQRDFQATLRFAPENEAARERLGSINELLTLDPTIRTLEPPERFRRTLKLVELTLDQASRCSAQNPSSELPGLIEAAHQVLKAHVRATRQSEASDSNLDLAEKLWKALGKECKPPPATDSPLALVMARLAQ
jgi:tetratricopeptide (TPR) repeat protein